MGWRDKLARRLSRHSDIADLGAEKALTLPQFLEDLAADLQTARVNAAKRKAKDPNAIQLIVGSAEVTLEVANENSQAGKAAGRSGSAAS